MSGKNKFDAGTIADAIKQNAPTILQTAGLNGILEVINQPPKKFKTALHLWEMAGWEAKKIPLLLWGSLLQDLKERIFGGKKLFGGKPLKDGGSRIYRSAIAIISIGTLPILAYLVFRLQSANFSYLRPLWESHPDILLKFLVAVWMAAPILAAIILVVLLPKLFTLGPFWNMWKRENVLIHYISKNDTVMKGTQSLPVPEAAECYLILTFKDAHNVSIDDFTAKRTKTLSTKVIGKLLAGIFSQRPQDPSVQTHATYHFTSGKLDATYVSEFKNNFPSNDRTIHDSRKYYIIKKMRESSVKYEVR